MKQAPTQYSILEKTNNLVLVNGSQRRFVSFYITSLTKENDILTIATEAHIAKSSSPNSKILIENKTYKIENKQEITLIESVFLAEKSPQASKIEYIKNFSTISSQFSRNEPAFVSYQKTDCGKLLGTLAMILDQQKLKILSEDDAKASAHFVNKLQYWKKDGELLEEKEIIYTPNPGITDDTPAVSIKVGNDKQLWVFIGARSNQKEYATYNNFKKILKEHEYDEQKWVLISDRHSVIRFEVNSENIEQLKQVFKIIKHKGCSDEFPELADRIISEVENFYPSLAVKFLFWTKKGNFSAPLPKGGQEITGKANRKITYTPISDQKNILNIKLVERDMSERPTFVEIKLTSDENYKNFEKYLKTSHCGKKDNFTFFNDKKKKIQFAMNKPNSDYFLGIAFSDIQENGLCNEIKEIVNDIKETNSKHIKSKVFN